VFGVEAGVDLDRANAGADVADRVAAGVVAPEVRRRQVGAPHAGGEVVGGPLDLAPDHQAAGHELGRVTVAVQRRILIGAHLIGHVLVERVTLAL
jgi:hypothetical protein